MTARTPETPIEPARPEPLPSLMTPLVASSDLWLVVCWITSLMLLSLWRLCPFWGTNSTTLDSLFIGHGESRRTNPMR